MVADTGYLTRKKMESAAPQIATCVFKASAVYPSDVERRNRAQTCSPLLDLIGTDEPKPPFLGGSVSIGARFGACQRL